MKIQQVKDNTKFGWRSETHEKITGMLVDEFPKLKKYKTLLTKMVLMPDVDERGFKGNNHFYYSPQLFRPRKSFMDFFGTNNAEARYSEHIYSFEKLVNKDNEKAFKEAGRALHFLQDVTQPHHVERGTILEKWRDLRVHKDFEGFVFRNQDKLINNAQKVNLDVVAGDYLDLFDEAVFNSELIKPAKNINKDSWYSIAQNGISNAIAVTGEFLKIISNALYK